MSSYEIKTQGVAYETYYVEASSLEEAKQLFAAGEVTEAAVIEVESVELLSISEVDR